MCDRARAQDCRGRLCVRNQDRGPLAELMVLDDRGHGWCLASSERLAAQRGGLAEEGMQLF